MGRGNTIIRREDGLIALNTHYIDLGDGEDEWQWSEIKEQLQDFKLKGQVNKNHHYNDRFRNDYLLLFETNVMQVIIADNESDMAIGCVPLPIDYGDENSKKNYPAFIKQANYYMQMLNKCHSLRVRAGAWTSGKVDSKQTTFY